MVSFNRYELLIGISIMCNNRENSVFTPKFTFYCLLEIGFLFVILFSVYAAICSDYDSRGDGGTYYLS